MSIPLELSFHNIEPSDALRKRVEDHVARLKQVHDHVINCRVIIELPHKSQKSIGNQPDVRVIVRLPGKEIVVSRGMNQNGHKKADNDPYAVVDEAFETARQQIRDWRRMSHGDVKHKTAGAES